MTIKAPNRQTRRTFVYTTWIISVSAATLLALYGPATDVAKNLVDWFMIYAIGAAGGYLGFGTADYIAAVKGRNNGREHPNG